MTTVAPRRDERRNVLSTLTVSRTEALDPATVRIHFACDLAPFLDRDNTDMYVKLVFSPTGSPFPPDADLRGLRSAPAAERPAVRTYSIRRVDVPTGTVAIDFALHPGPSVAAAWAERAAPGDVVQFKGPGGRFRPAPDAHNLFVADPAGLPAALAGIEALPAGAHATLFVEYSDGLPLPPFRHDCVLTTTLCRSRDDATSPLATAVRAWDWPEGPMRVFAHGEADVMMKNLRPYFRERGVRGENLSVSGYWRRGQAEDDFQASKRTDPAVLAARDEDARDAQ